MESDQSESFTSLFDNKYKESIENCDNLDINEPAYPANDEEALLLFLIQIDQNSNSTFSLQDLLAQSIFLSEQNYKNPNMQSQVEYLNIYRKIYPKKLTTDFTSFLKLSRIIKNAIKEAEKMGLSPENFLTPLCFSNEVIDLLLNGEKKDWLRYKELEEENMQYPVEKPTQHMLTCFQILGYFASVSSIKEGEDKNQSEEDDKLIEDQEFRYFLLLPFRLYKNIQKNYPNSYNEWKNHILTLLQSDFIVDTVELIDYIKNKQAGLVFLYFSIETYKNELLAKYFNILYNPLYSEQYRNCVLHILQQQEYGLLLPYHDQYCREKNIPLEQRYSLGNTPDIPNKYIEDLSYIDSEKPDEDKDQHFGLSFKFDTVKYLFDNIKGSYIDPDTDIRLFCYRLTGKGKPDKITYLKWIVDEKSLAFFIRRLGVCKNNCWQKTEAFWGNNANNLKTAYFRLTLKKDVIQTDETNIKMLDSIVTQALVLNGI